MLPCRPGNITANTAARHIAFVISHLAWRYALCPSTWAAPQGPPVLDVGP